MDKQTQAYTLQILFNEDGSSIGIKIGQSAKTFAIVGSCYFVRLHSVNSTLLVRK